MLTDENGSNGLNGLSDSARELAAVLEQLITDSNIDVPMLPEVASKALILAHNPESDAGEMARLIQSDQSLAGHVMRIANSAVYMPASNLVSLQQAIARLGMALISEVALAAAIGAKMFSTPGYEDYVADIWRHALATSLWSKEIARHCRRNVEVAFLSGLLHSIGRPAVLQAILDLAKDMQLELSEQDIFQLENHFCQSASEAVIQSWEMPKLVIESVVFFNDFESAPTASHQAALVNAGVRFSDYMLDDSETEEPDQDSENRATLMASPALVALNLYQDEIESLLAQTETIAHRLTGLLS